MPETIQKFKQSLLFSVRDTLLSWTLPISWAIALHDTVAGKTAAETGVFKQFVDELQDKLVVIGGSSEFVATLIPQYLTETLRDQLYTGEIFQITC